MSAGSTAIKAGRAFVEILTDTSKLEQGLNRSRTYLRGFASFVESAGSKMMLSGLATGGGMLASINAFAQFEDRMKAVQAVTEATEDAYKRMFDIGRKVGRDLGYTPTESAAAMIELGKAGFNSDDIETATRAVLALSRAAGEDLMSTTINAAQTLKSFNMEASQMAQIADLMVVAANKSTATVEMLNESLAYSAPVAQEFNISLKDTLKILAVLAGMGIKGSMAGTSFRQILLQFADQDKRNTLAQWGVQVTDVQGRIRGLADIMVDVAEAAKAMPQANRLSFLKELFDQRAVSSAMKIMHGDFREITRAMDNATGAAERQAQMMQTSLLGVWRQFKSDLENVQITMTQGIVPALMAIGSSLKSATDWLNAFMKSNQELTGIIVAMLAVISPLGIALTGLGWSLRALFGGLTVFFTGLKIARGLFVAFDQMLWVSAKNVKYLGTAYTFASDKLWGLYYAMAAHPVLAGIVAASAAISAIGVYAIQSSRKVAKLNEETAKLRETRNQQRGIDSTDADRLKKMGGHILTPAGMKEAEGIIKRLTGKYGDLGMTIDKSNRQVLFAADTWDRLAAALKAAALVDVEKDISDTKKNLDALQEQMRQDVGSRLISFGIGSKDAAKAQEKAIKDASDEFDRLSKYYRDLQSLKKSLLPTPADSPEPNMSALKLSDDEIAWAKKLHELKLAQVEDEHLRKIALINSEYEEEARKIRTKEDITDSQRGNLMYLAEQSRSAEFAKIELEFAKERKKFEIEGVYELEKLKAEAIYDDHERAMAMIEIEYNKELDLIKEIGNKKEAQDRKSQADALYAARKESEEQQRANQAVEADAERAWAIEELKAKTTMRGKKLALELNEIERRKAIAEANIKGENLETINKEFDLRKRMIEMESSGPTVAGTFSSLGVGNALGTQSTRTWDKILGETIKMNGHLAALVRRNPGEGGIVAV